MEILAVGLGSLGAAFIRNLVENFHFSSLHLVDHDRVEERNIEKHPFFTIADIGRFKTDVISDYYRNKTKFTLISHPLRIEQVPLNFFARFSIIIAAIDSLTTRRWLNWALYETHFGDDKDVPIFIEAGCEGNMAHSRLFRPMKRRKGPCIECTKNLYKTGDESIALCSIPPQLRSIEQCIQWASISCFDLREIMEIAKKKAQEVGLDYESISLSKCEQFLNRTVPTDPETNQRIAREALNELKKGEDWKKKTLFISLQNECEAQKIILEPSDEYCHVCW
jgi:molybdopterin/thiamine biosynthesis adenylyltransferase